MTLQDKTIALALKCINANKAFAKHVAENYPAGTRVYARWKPRGEELPRAVECVVAAHQFPASELPLQGLVVCPPAYLLEQWPKILTLPDDTIAVSWAMLVEAPIDAARAALSQPKG